LHALKHVYVECAGFLSGNTEKVLGGEKMKKVLLFVVIAMFMMVPLAFAKTAITEKDLSDVTAQEGVTIDFSCFTLGSVNIAVQGWGDSDGCTSCGGYTSAGWVGNSMNTSANFLTIGGTMTIDVGTSGTRTALVIGLPTLTMSGDMTQVVKLANASGGLNASTQVLGTSYMSGLSLSPTGNLIIYAH
jgi:hypothetical protein